MKMALIPPARIKKEIEEAMNSKTIVDFGFVNDDHMKWYFLIDGPKDSPYEGGEYIFCAELNNGWPTTAPAISLLTPSGRFKPGSKICIDGASHYHSNTYSAAMRLALLLEGFISIMVDDGENGISHIHETTEVRQKLARNSSSWNKQWTSDNAIVWQKRQS